MVRTDYTADEFNTAESGICPGPDFEWFAVDRDLFVAGFTNAGFATVPQTVFGSFDAYIEALDAVHALQRVGCANWVRNKPPRFETWNNWAEHGFFAYDWAHAIGHPDPSLPYELMCVPDHPIHLSLLPQSVAIYIAKTQFNELSFLNTRKLFV